jgi:UDP-N-acetylglucosamine 2-epimerase (non-hydrolysing)
MKTAKDLGNKDIWILVGTRPEVIKQALVYMECVKSLGADRVALVGTGQHKELLEQALAHFDLKLDVNFEIMRPGQALSVSAAQVLADSDALLAEQAPKWIVVQGDTTSAAMAALAAFHRGVKVAHNEAGLRSYDLAHPFPEEANRRLISVVAALNFAPTEKARSALLKEGVDPSTILVTGNSGIDALLWTLERPAGARAKELLEKIQSQHRKPVLMTAHRRENHGDAVEKWFQAIARSLEKHQDLALIYPMHPNKMAQQAAEKYLSQNPAVHLIEPLDYNSTCHVLQNCCFVVTDSGGIQEEAATLGVPTVVCRNTTERSEALDAGIAKLTGLEIDKILDGMEWAYNKGSNEERRRLNPFGDGRAAQRIAEELAARL